MDIVYYRKEDFNVPPNESVDPFMVGSDYIQTHPSVAIPYLTVIIMATISGTVGNILVIGAVITNKHLKTVGNMFLVNLAVADLWVTGFVDPFSIIGIVRGEVYFAERPVLCEFIASICLTSCFCSLLSIGAISFNRFIHICHNHLYERVYTKLHTVLMCIGLWIISFLAEVSSFFGWGDHVYDRKTLSCVWDRTADFSYSLFFSTVGVAFPVMLITICYIKIFLHVKASKVKVRQAKTVTASEKSAIREKSESVKLARTLCLIFVVFAVCWTPYAFIVVLDKYDTYPQEVHIFSILVAHTNSSLNSVLYGVTNRHFRRGYMKLLCIDKCLKGRERDQTNTKSETRMGTDITGAATAKDDEWQTDTAMPVACKNGKEMVTLQIEDKK